MFDKEINHVISIFNHNHVDYKEGMTNEQIEQAERFYKIHFPIELRTLLMTVLPISSGFYDWTNYSEKNCSYIHKSLNWPIEGILFDIEHNELWLDKYWGSKPDLLIERLKLAEQYLSQVPKLIPIYGHRYIPTSFEQKLLPIFSVYQSDIIYYGRNLWDYFKLEFGSEINLYDIKEPLISVPFWEYFVD